jgi:hypothetical protein
MNRAATTDLRGAFLWPTIVQVLGSAPTDRLGRIASLVREWQNAGSSRLDTDLDGAIDHPGAAIMDAAWPRLADAALAPVLGPLVDRLAQLERRNDEPSDGNAFGSGWYSYVEKDLAVFLGPFVRRPFTTRFCGGGDRTACSASLWAALDAAVTELEAAQGPDPAAWRASATAERTTYGFLPRSMRFANRPTFQQVVTFTGHRPRR